jgi:SAM-dependent methyltransferase
MTQKVFANLGCGPSRGRPAPRIFAGWSELRVDVDPSAGPDIVADITDLSAIPTNSMNGVWCSHCIEHVYQHQAPIALGEIRRILSPDGLAVILTPDLQRVATALVEDRMLDPLYQSPAGPISAHDIVYGFGSDIARGLTFMAHRCGFTPSVMMRALGQAGFEHYVLFRRDGYELAVLAAKSGWSSVEDREAAVSLLR